MKKTLIPLFVVTLLSFASPSFAQNGPPAPAGWSYSLGAGVFYSPNYLGDDEGQVAIFPNFRIAYADTFFASLGEGIGYNVINNEHWQVGPIIKYRFSREEDGSSPFALGDDTQDLVGLGDVDGTAELGAYIQYTLNPVIAKVNVRQGIGGHEGLVIESSLHYRAQATLWEQRFIYSLGPEITYTGASYNESYFSVNASQAAASGLSTYDANDGSFSYGIGGSIVIPHNRKVSTIVFADYTRLGDTIADSSLVSERGDPNQASLGVVVNYTF